MKNSLCKHNHINSFVPSSVKLSSEQLLEHRKVRRRCSVTDVESVSTLCVVVFVYCCTCSTCAYFFNVFFILMDVMVLCWCTNFSSSKRKVTLNLNSFTYQVNTNLNSLRWTDSTPRWPSDAFLSNSTLKLKT